MKTKTGILGILIAILALGILFAQPALSQNTLQFTSVNATSEGAIQLHWASNSNEVYEIDYADSLIDTNTGSTTWNQLYTDYPSQGTNTFVADCGNYDLSPAIPHPKLSPMRFYRVMHVENDSLTPSPTVSIVSPTNGDSFSGNMTVQISASSPDILADVKLYVDGEEQWPTYDGTNFVINTCEWPNGNHVLFATAKSQSGLEGVANGGVITYAHSVSPFVNVTFSNLISRFDFSQPFFEPALGQTQAVTATFAANCDWTLQIQDANSNVVRTATGSGNSMEFDWDGTGDGETSIPDGVYTYLLSAETNGEADEIVTNGSSGGGGNPPSPNFELMDSPELWVMSADGNDAAPLAIYPPGFDTNNLTIFSATPSQVQAARSTFAQTSSFETGDASPDYSGPSGQSTAGPTRKPKTGVKGAVGTFGICYKTYGTNGFNSVHPTTGWPYPLPTYVAIDGQARTDHTVDYRIWTFRPIADDFASVMERGGWKAQFVKADDQWSATDIKKTSLGGNSIFNTCNFGVLMTHGSYGNDGSTGTEDDNVQYTYCWLGGNNFVRLSDMDFGSAGTNGLRWMTIFACNILRSQNYSSMNNAGKIPVNDNLHLLLGFSSTGYAAYHLGKDYANYMVNSNYTIVNSLADACADSYTENSKGITNIVTIGISGWDSCMNDSLTLYNDPDLNEVDYNERTVFIPQ
jgi:Family of unknown function (DUF6345)/Bacterial Ig domain/FlgD Ig-like domain